MRKIIFITAVLGCLGSVAAFAATPAKNSSFQHCPSKDRCPFGFETNKTGTKIVDIKLYNDCVAAPANYPDIKIRAGGRFSKSGTVKDVIGKQITYRIEGRFTRPKKAVGTYDGDTARCSEKARKFTAKRVGKAQPGF